MDELTYVLATAADARIVTDLRIAFADELVGKAPEEQGKKLRESLENYFSAELNKNYICWLAKAGEEVIAAGGLVIRTGPGNIKNLSGITGYLMNIYTAPEHRRKGISGNIVNRLTETAKERGITAFELHATKAGEPLYVKNGFVLFPEPTYRKIIS